MSRAFNGVNGAREREDDEGYGVAYVEPVSAPPIRVTYHCDGGHGWLEVPRAEVERLGIASKVSSCSYQQGGAVYLEHDCDAVLFMQACKTRGIDVVPSENYTEGDSPIRRMKRFTP
jgi:hypothetical protein